MGTGTLSELPCQFCLFFETGSYSVVTLSWNLLPSIYFSPEITGMSYHTCLETEFNKCLTTLTERKGWILAEMNTQTQVVDWQNI